MTIDRKKLRWNGWGWVDAPDMLGERADAVWAWMAEAVGVDRLPETPAKPLEEISLPKLRLGPTRLEALERKVSAERVKTDPYERAFHARGKSYHDLVKLRRGEIDHAPDAVVYPETEDEVFALIQWAATENIALVPYGGGSSVVGGVTAQGRDADQPVVTLDLTLMDQILEIDERARTARVQPGVYGPALEEALQARGWTLGHYPQSFEFSTLGGWIAHRGAGQQSNKYGKAEKWVVSTRLATPKGVWTTEGFPASAAGPQLTQSIVGSEGVLGVITEATVRIQPKPEAMDYRGYMFQEFEKGCEAIRAIVQAGVPTAMIRLSDLEETYFFSALQMAGKGGPPRARFCMMIVGLEGDRASVDAALEKSRKIVEAGGGMHMGEGFGESWYKNRFGSPYLRDPMMDRGMGVDTLETSTNWSNLLPLHAKVTQTIGDAMAAHPGKPGANAIVMAHISHSYPDGASLYFTFSFLRDLEDELGQWWAIKRAASDVILENGGTISHHHGVGTDHREWATREKGPVGSAVLRAMKHEVDPKRILNPGKLIAE